MPKMKNAFNVAKKQLSIQVDETNIKLNSTFWASCYAAINCPQYHIDINYCLLVFLNIKRKIDKISTKQKVVSTLISSTSIRCPGKKSVYNLVNSFIAYDNYLDVFLFAKKAVKININYSNWHFFLTSIAFFSIKHIQKS